MISKPSDKTRELTGGPNMLQESYDGRRLYVSNSLYSTRDNQFYPGLGSWLLRIDCDPNGGLEIMATAAAYPSRRGSSSSRPPVAAGIEKPCKCRAFP